MKFLKPKFWDYTGISFFAILLLPFAISFKLIFFLKKILSREYNFSIPVICVGNIYLGGTGKTPICIELFSILKKLNKKPSFVRKKYKSFQDEINLLKKTGPAYENKKRSEAINEAIRNKSDIVILDDGFQDFSIKKKLSIVCFNETQWIGNGLTIPAGPLRENISALNRANYVFIIGKKNITTESKIFEINKLIKIFYLDYELENIKQFEKKKVISFAGIGNPNNFFDLLQKNSVNILEQISFPDHYNYTNKDLENLIKKAKGIDAVLLTTEKDYERIPKNYKEDIKCIKLKIIIDNKEKLIEEIKAFI